MNGTFRRGDSYLEHARGKARGEQKSKAAGRVYQRLTAGMLSDGGQNAPKLPAKKPDVFLEANTCGASSARNRHHQSDEPMVVVSAGGKVPTKRPRPTSHPHLHVEVFVELESLAEARQDRRKAPVQGSPRVEPQQRQVPRQEVKRRAKAPALVLALAFGCTPFGTAQRRVGKGGGFHFTAAAAGVLISCLQYRQFEISDLKAKNILPFYQDEGKRQVSYAGGRGGLGWVRELLQTRSMPTNQTERGRGKASEASCRRQVKSGEFHAILSNATQKNAQD